MTREQSLTILLSTILAVEGWLITHLSDQINNTPLMEYKIEDISDENSRAVRFQIQNLNHVLSYKDITVKLIAPAGSKIIQSTAVPVEPAWEGDEQPSESPDSSVLNIPNLMPWSVIRIYVKYQGERPSIRIASTAQSIMSSKPSFETLIAKYQGFIMVAMMPSTIIIGFISVILHNLYYRGRRSK